MLNQTDINIGIYETDRREVASHLAVLLAESYMLYLKTQNFHWNVTGRMFGSLHILFENHYREMAEAIDEIAESIRELGFHAPATFDEFQKRTAIREAVGIPKSQEMILELVIGHEVVIETSRILLEAAQVAGDSATADLAVRRIQSHEKSAWMLRSHLED